MRRYRILACIVVSILLAGVSATGYASGPVPQAAAQEAANPDTASGEKKVLTIDDYGRWRSVVSAAISDDGAWVSFGYRKREADDELHTKNVDDGTDHLIERGSDPEFSDDSRWVAYEIALPWEEIEELEEDNDPVPVQAELMDLSNGTKIGPWDNIDSFEFAESSLALAIKRRRPDSGGGGGGGRADRGGGRGAGGEGGGGDDSSPRGSDLIIRHLDRGYEELLGSVDLWSFNEPGTHLAYTVDAADDNGNGVYLIDLATGARRALDNDKAEYARLTWDEGGTSLAVLRGTTPEGFDERDNALLVFPGIASGSGLGGELVVGTDKIVYAPAEDDSFPEGFVVSERGALAFNEGATKIFFGIKEQLEEPEQTDDPIADVNIFHWRDERIQWRQKAQAESDRNLTYRSVLNLAGASAGTFVRLADERMRTVRLTRDGRWGVGEDDKSYISDWEPRRADYYRIDTETGERTLMLEGFTSRGTMGISPDGKHFLSWQGEQVWDWQLDTGETSNLTLSSAEGSDPLSFVNTEWDRFGEPPSYGVAGWTKDGSAVILNHKHDLYLQPLDGSRATNLTGGAASKDEIRYRLLTLDEDDRVSFPAGGSATVVDLSQPQLLSAYGQWTKKAGYFELPAGGGEPVELVSEGKRFAGLLEAEDAGRYYYTVEDFTQFPDYWVADSSFGSPTRITDANPWQDEYEWGHRILFDYTNGDGVPLQGILAIPRLPAGRAPTDDRALLREDVAAAARLSDARLPSQPQLRGLRLGRLPDHAARRSFPRRQLALRHARVRRGGHPQGDRARLRRPDGDRAVGAQLQRRRLVVHRGPLEDVRRGGLGRGAYQPDLGVQPDLSRLGPEQPRLRHLRPGALRHQPVRRPGALRARVSHHLGARHGHAAALPTRRGGHDGRLCAGHGVVQRAALQQQADHLPLVPGRGPRPATVREPDRLPEAAAPVLRPLPARPRGARLDGPGQELPRQGARAEASKEISNIDGVCS